MRRYAPFCLLAALIAQLWGCGESPNRPTVETVTPINPPKSSARFIQVPWDISLFFNLPGGAVTAGSLTAATAGGRAEGDNLTGTFVNSNGFAGTISGILTGTLENGNFDGILTTVTPSGCSAERRFSGPVTTALLNWSVGPHVNDCGGTSPLTSGIQVTAAPANAPPPCTYTTTVSTTSFPAAGGTGTANVDAGTGCSWFALSTSTFVTLSAGQGTTSGSVQYTVAPNTSTAARTAVIVVAGQSFTITQAGAPAPVCNYTLNATERTFDANGALGGVDMRVATGCAWQAQSNAPWLTITGGAGGTGDGTISYAVAANPALAQRVGVITAQGRTFTVTQLGIVCTFTVTPPAITSFEHPGGSGSASVVTQPPCPWTAASDVPWITITPPPGGTGEGALGFTVAANTVPVARAGVLTVAGRAIPIMQGAAPCVYTLTPSATIIGFPGGTATIGVATHTACNWTATVAANAPWITIAGAASGAGNGTVTLNFAANNTALQRSGIVTIGGQTVTFTQPPTNLGTLSGVVTNSLSGQAIASATVQVIPIGSSTGPSVTTSAAGAYTVPNLVAGSYNVLVQSAAFADARAQITITAAQTTTYNAALVPRPVNLVMTWAPNPTSVDPNDVGCGQSGRFCWRSQLTIQETSGTAASVTSLMLHFYDGAGNPTQSLPATIFTPFTLPGGTTIQTPSQATLPSSAGGRVEFELGGTDPFGRTFTFRSPQLFLNPFGVLSLTNGTAQPGATGGGMTGTSSPAPRTIRRR